MDLFGIPVHYRQLLLPNPECSVSELLQFPLPPQAHSKTRTKSQYWSPAMPAAVDIENLKSLAIPCCTSLKDIREQVYRHHILEQASSIQYPHLSASCYLENFPLWVVMYWIESSQLCQYVKEPWHQA